MTSIRFGRSAGVLLALALLVVSWSVYFRGDFRNVDVDFYHLYALRFWTHLQHPLLPDEYPPLSIVVFAVTLLGPPGLFPVTFALFMAAIASAGYVLYIRFTSPRQAGAYVLYVLAAGLATLFFRYDLIPALITTSAVWLMNRRRFKVVYVLLAVGTLLKIFPIVLVPVVAVAHRRSIDSGSQRWTAPLLGVAVCSALIALGFGAAALIDPGHTFSSLSYDVRRPDEVESIPATALWLASLAGVGVRPDSSFGSLNVVGPASTVVTGVADAALVVALVLIYWRQARARYSSGQAALAVLLIVLCTSRVLSAQYFIWIAPVLAVIVGFQMRWLWLLLLTGLIFPTLFELTITGSGVVAYSNLFFVVIAARNAWLLAVTAVYLRRPGLDLQAATLISGSQELVRGAGVSITPKT